VSEVPLTRRLLAVGCVCALRCLPSSLPIILQRTQPCLNTAAVSPFSPYCCLLPQALLCQAPDRHLSSSTASPCCSCRHLSCRYEEEQAVLRTLRMTLRDLTMELLGSRRWQQFWEPEPADSDWWDKVRGAASSVPGSVCHSVCLCPCQPVA
jgi:hypothetical protein